MGSWNVHYAKRFDRKRKKRKRKAKAKKPGDRQSLFDKVKRYWGAEPIKGKWIYRYAEDHLRKMTAGERAFWGAARKQKRVCQLWPQFPLYGYIADFYCLDHRIVIEIDGGYHQTAKQKAKDQIRDQFLRDQSIVVLRFADTTESSKISGYLWKISHICELREKQTLSKQEAETINNPYAVKSS